MTSPNKIHKNVVNTNTTDTNNTNTKNNLKFYPIYSHEYQTSYSTPNNPYVTVAGQKPGLGYKIKEKIDKVMHRH